MTFDDQSVIARTEGLMSTQVGEDLVVLNLPTNSYIGFDSTGRRVWTLLETPLTVEELTRHMVDEFQGDAAVIGADIRRFVESLISNGLAHVVEK